MVYKNKHFPDKKMRIGIDKETYWSDLIYKEMMMVYRDEDKCIPAFAPTPDGGWEALPRIMALGLDPTLENRQYLIDVRAVGFEPITRLLGHILQEESILIGHNFKYDLAPLMHMMKIVPKEPRCTMLMAQTKNTGDKILLDGDKASFKLSLLYKRYIDEGLFISLTGKTPEEYEDFKSKNQKSEWDVEVLDEDQLQYSADDVRLIFYLYHSLMDDCSKFMAKYPQNGLINNIKIECRAALEYADMEVRGIGADAYYIKNELIPYLEDKHREAIEAISGTDTPEMWVLKEVDKCPKTNPHTVSWMEPLTKSCKSLQTPQLAECVQKLGFKLTKKTPSGKALSTDKEVLNELFWESEVGRARDIIEKIIQVKKASKNLSSYGYKMLDMIHSDGRYHPSALQLGDMNDAIETGRNSFKDPPMQTIPARDKLFKELLESIKFFTVFDDHIKTAKAEGNNPIADAFTIFRRMVVSREGYTLINADFSNEEVRVIGELSCDIEIIKAFKNKEDLHQKTADNIGVDRDTGKLFFLASQYGAWERRIQRALYEGSGGKLFIEKKDITVMRNQHFAFYNGLAAKIKECEEYVERQLAPYNSLLDFANRKPMLVGFTPVYRKHRFWCLTPTLERMVASLNRQIRENKAAGLPPPVDYLHRNYKVTRINDKGEEYQTTYGNFFNTRKSEIIREYFNFLVQAECAVILKVALINIGNAFRAKGYDMKTEGVILVVHDEILAEVKDEHVEEAKQIIHDEMVKALETVLKKIPAVVGIGTGKNWMEACP